MLEALTQDKLLVPDGSIWYPKHDQSCVFYAPLWHPRLGVAAGGSFQSLDRIGHTCAITGATWGKYGRILDGSDDQIVDSAATGMPSGNPSFSVIAWINSDDDSVTIRTIYGLGSALPNGFDFSTNRRAARDLTLAYGENGYTTNTATISINTWEHVAVTYSGSNPPIIYYNGVSQSLATWGVGNPAMNINLGTSIIGRSIQVAYTFRGIIGEVWVYNRALTLAEITRIYEKTKWRYRS